jgi:phenylpyruvate tautomerase PptA (4-oxalocrotonate tautomerase family)
MPLIDLTLPRGALPRAKIQPLVHELMTALLKWERAPRSSAIAREITWTYVNEVDCLYVAARRADQPRYRVSVTVPAGMLGAPAKAGLVRDMTTAILQAEDADDPSASFRVWCLINEVPDGNWGADGKIFRREDIVDLVMRNPVQKPPS